MHLWSQADPRPQPRGWNAAGRMPDRDGPIHSLRSPGPHLSAEWGDRGHDGFCRGRSRHPRGCPGRFVLEHFSIGDLLKQCPRRLRSWLIRPGRSGDRPDGSATAGHRERLGSRSGGRGHALRTTRDGRNGDMEPCARVASGRRHRGPARGAVDCSQSDNRLPDRSHPDNHPKTAATPTTTSSPADEPRRHVAGRLSADEFSPRLCCSRFHARAGDGPTSSGPSSGTAPSSPPVTWCESGLPTSPYTSAPAGSVTVSAGDNGV